MRISIIDAHMDSIEKTYSGEMDFESEEGLGQVHLKGMVKAGVLVSFFTVFYPELEMKDFRGINSFLNSLLNKRSKLNIVQKFEDIAEDKINVIKHLEGADIVNKDLSNLVDFYEKGIRSIGLTWYNENQFAGGTESNQGLTEEGEELIRECEKMGIVVDLAHMNRESFQDGLEVIKKAPIVSHANCRALADNPRNLDDEQLKALRDKGGVIGISFCSSFLGEDNASIEDVIKHIDHAVDVMGVEHVGFGSDFDGSSVPVDLNDVSKYPKLVKRLQENYTKRKVEKLAYKNFLRILKETLEPSSKSSDTL